MDLSQLKLISAGAGSGKTYRLTQELTRMLAAGEIRPEGIIATTFTRKAAAELRERVRVKLLEEGKSREANLLTNALIGTVHGLGIKLLKRFAFEAGVSPRVDIIADGDGQRLFNLSLAAVLEVDDIDRIEGLCERLSLSVNGEKYNWRRDILDLVEVIRANNFSEQTIALSKQRSWNELAEFLPESDQKISLEQYHQRLEIAIQNAIVALENNETDATKKTQSAVAALRSLSRQLRVNKSLPWVEHAKLADFGSKVSKKSEELVADLQQLAARHPALAAFQADIKAYQDYIFDYAERAIQQYETYKKSRGRIDYTDMEVLVLQLLDDSRVSATLAEEIDLLLVDEFQDTSPIQLAIFLRLSQLATHSIWVGDPKQSIYGFRGAEPRLMRAVMNATPNDPANIQTTSYRSRRDVVYACNALFVRAFPELPPEKIALEAHRQPDQESPTLRQRAGLVHWHFELDGKGRTSIAWQRDMVAKAVRELIEDPPPILPKGERGERLLRPGDIAILCRSNYGCAGVAEALEKQGIPAALSRNGLMGTPEAALILACLRFLLNGRDSLSIAEILYLGGRWSLPEIIRDRIEDLKVADRTYWANDQELISELNRLRAETKEYAASETLNLLLERLDLRRRIVAWGDGEQRLSNVDELRGQAVAYEENCHRQHRAASLGGFLLFLDRLVRSQDDKQGASERPGAVNVLTYHKSKGLEWPAVVCFDLNQPLRASIWGRDIVATRPYIDLEQPLADRWLRYWVTPYGSRAKPKLDWLAAIEESRWQTEAEAAARAEEARLLYVGFTRARDYLICPTDKDGAGWVDRVYARGGTEVSVLSPDTPDTPFSWHGVDIDKYTQTRKEPKNIPGSPPRNYSINFISGLRQGEAEYAPRVFDEAFLIQEFYGAGTERWDRFYDWPDHDPATDERYFNQLAAGYYHAHVGLGGEAERRETIEELWRRFEPGGEPKAADLMASATALDDHLRGFIGHHDVRHHQPLRYTYRGRTISENIDWVMESTNGSFLLVDSLAPLKQLKTRAPAFIARLNLLATAYRELTGQPVLGAAIVHPYSGNLIQS